MNLVQNFEVWTTKWTSSF